MNGYDIYRRVMSLLGYSLPDNPSDDRRLSRVLHILNQLASDLKLDPVSSVSQEIKATELKAEALCYGCAMLLALAEGDGAKNRLFADIYNAKRASALSGCEIIEDTLPDVGSGGV